MPYTFAALRTFAFAALRTFTFAALRTFNYAEMRIFSVATSRSSISAALEGTQKHGEGEKHRGGGETPGRKRNKTAIS